VTILFNYRYLVLAGICARIIVSGGTKDVGTEVKDFHVEGMPRK
jgi:hypothetical protein